MTEHQMGTLTADGGRWTLTFARHLAHPPDKVWRAVTEAEHLGAWFPDRIVGEWRVGAALRFVNEHGDGFDGELLAFDPPRSYTILWGTDLLHLTVEPERDGTLLTLTDTFDELGKAARDAAGWHECLDRLDCELAGSPPPAPGQVWAAVHPSYVERLGPEAAAIGPPEGWSQPAS